MQSAELWNDHTFRVLLDDLFKARKDEKLGPLRLEAIFRYVEGTQPVPTGKPGPQLPAPKKILAARPTPLKEGEAPAPIGGFELDEAEPEVAETPKSYLEARRAERRNPEETLNLAADIVQKAVEEGRWSENGTMTVQVPRHYVVSGLEAILHARRVPISALSCSIPPKRTKIDVHSASAISGSDGEGTGGWTVMLSR